MSKTGRLLNMLLSFLTQDVQPYQTNHSCFGHSPIGEAIVFPSVKHGIQKEWLSLPIWKPMLCAEEGTTELLLPSNKAINSVRGYSWRSEVHQLIKIPATEPMTRTFLRAHIVKGENLLPKVAFWPLSMLSMNSHCHTHNKNEFEF